MASSDGEVQLSFLLTGTSDLVPPSYIKLRSYLNIHLTNVADQQNLNLPKSFRNRNKTCPYCYTDWSNDTSSFKLLPSKKIKLHQNGKEKKIKKGQIEESRNTLVLKCKVCTKKSLFSLVKRKPVKVTKEETVKSVKKKKKKKDKLCGLLVSLKKEGNPVAEVSKKKKRLKNTNQNKNPFSASKSPQSNFSGSSKNITIPSDKSNSFGGKNKKFVPNPFASQHQGKKYRKKNKKLQGLKKAVKGGKGVNLAKKTLKDFLTVI